MWVALRYSGYDQLVHTISSSSSSSSSIKSASTGSAETAIDNGSIASDGCTGVSSIHDRYVDTAWKLDFSPSAYLNDSYALLHLV